MKGKAIVLDPYATNEFHQVFNASVVIMSSIAFNEMVYYAHSSACNSIHNFLKEIKDTDYSNIEYKLKNKATNFKGRLGYLRKIIVCSLWIILQYLKIEKGHTIIITQNLAPLLHLLNLISKFKKNKVVIFCHSEMELLISKDSNLSMTNKIVKFLFVDFFQRRQISTYLNFVVLGDNMKSLLNRYFSLANQHSLYVIDHPYIKGPILNNNENDLIPNYQKVRIGITGLLDSKRGVDEVTNLLKKINPEEVKVYSISKVVSDLNLEELGLIQLNKSSELLPQAIYSNYVSQMDYILFTYPLNSYRLTASGAALEAIWWEKPIIALKNHYLSYLFSKYGRLGILFDTIDELADYINKINDQEGEDLGIFKDNLKKAKEELLPRNVVKQLIDNSLF